MVSIVIPAHNEGAVIARCLGRLIEGAHRDEFDIIVVANGCADDTAARARSAAPGARVIETATASKANALNLGDRAAVHYPRLYLDADVVISAQSVRTLAAALAHPGTLAAAPAVNMVFLPKTHPAVRAYYRFWLSLPHVRDGMITAGAYALTEEGRARFDEFPDVISDDGFVRLQFTPSERVEVAAACSEVTAPASLSDLIRVRTRVRLSVRQLKARYPELFRREAASKRYSRALGAVLSRPALYPAAAVYAWVQMVSRLRAASQARSSSKYVWERDDSSRLAGTAPARPPEATVR